MDRPKTEHSATPRRRRVLVLIKCMGHGGAERLVVSMMRHRDRDRFDYEVAYIFEDLDALVPQLREAGVPVHSLGSSGNADLRWLPRLRRLLADGDFDIVHSHLPYAATFARLVASTRSPRPALVYTEHGVWDRMPRALRTIDRMTIGLDDQLIVVSEACRRSLPPSLQRKARVVIHGIELDAIRDAMQQRSTLRPAVRAELGVPDDELLVMSVAVLRWQKGFDVLLSAARATVDRGVPVHFAAVGDGPLRADLEAQRQTLSLGQHFAFLGEREDVPRLLTAADVFVIPSRYEGLPLALMEAVCGGLPIVATDVGELPTLLTDGTDALIVPPEHPQALTDALVELADHPELRARLGAAASALAERFDVRRCVREVESIYDELVPQPTELAR